MQPFFIFWHIGLAIFTSVVLSAKGFLAPPFFMAT